MNHSHFILILEEVFYSSTCHIHPIVRGITLFIDGQSENLDSFFQLAEKVSVDLKLAKKDDVIIANCGESIFKVGTTNSIKLFQFHSFYIFLKYLY